MHNVLKRTLIAAGAAAVGMLAIAATGAAAAGSAGNVYTLTNEAGGNAVAVFDRHADGELTAAGTYATGGLGSGGGLGSQGAVILSDDGELLFAVNAGSDDISSFTIDENGLTLADTVASGGDRPIGVTHHDGLLYVVNAGGAGNISGIAVDADGELTPLANSTRPLSTAASGPAQVEFSPDGDLLVVTEKNTNVISTYTVDGSGLATGPNAQPSAGATPFGFAFDKRGTLIVSEAFGGAPGASAVSSYQLTDDGDLTAVTPSVATTETAACWIAITKNGRYAYTTNTGSGTITGYSIGNDGSLTILDTDGITGVTGAGTSPIDAALSRNGRFLYTINTGSDDISVFAVGADGSLTALDGIGGLPASSVGLAAS
jgi:6-phosphogluconolactonase (cycloisomerase 2 family)